MKPLKSLGGANILKFRAKPARNLTSGPGLRNFCTKNNFITTNGTNSQCISTDYFSRRNITTSSFRSSASAQSVATNSAPSDDAHKPELSLGKEEFVAILKMTTDKSNNLFSLIHKCKEDLQKLSMNSYPFKRYDLRAVMELLSGLLSLQSSKKDLDLLCKLLESHKSDTKMTFGLDLCKLFSSSYDGVSKRESPLMTKIANKGMMMLAKFFVPNFIESVSQNNLNGVKFAFNALSDSINSQNLKTLEACCNGRLFNLIKNGIEFLNSLKLKIKFNINSIDQLMMDKFYLTIGGKRSDMLRDIFSARESGINPVLITRAGPPRNTEEYRELILKAFEKGAILRMEVILQSNQTLSLLDENEEELWSDFKPLCTHRLCFESEFKLSPDSKPGKKIDFDTGDWVLVDINGVLNNNNPF